MKEIYFQAFTKLIKKGDLHFDVREQEEKDASFRWHLASLVRITILSWIKRRLLCHLQVRSTLAMRLPISGRGYDEPTSKVWDDKKDL